MEIKVMKTAYLKFKDCKTNDMTNENFQKVGNNTGNIVFDYSLMTTIKCTPLELEELERQADDFDNLVVRDFIWIKENMDMGYFREIMKFFKNKPIIPISAGIQAITYKSDFKLHENTVRILKEIAEKAEIAVRGEYTAEIFNKYGIRNIRIIGCPSLYLGGNYRRKVIKDEKVDWKSAVVLANYKTLAKELDNDLDHKVLKYLMDHSSYFVEQTKCYFPQEMRESVFKSFMQYYVKNRMIYFKFRDWYKFCQGK